MDIQAAPVFLKNPKFDRSYDERVLTMKSPYDERVLTIKSPYDKRVLT